MAQDGEQELPPAGPADLLWAHQLRREHGYLLQRIKDLEATTLKFESRLKAAEELNLDHDTKGRVQVLESKLEALANGAVSGANGEAIKKLEQDLKNMFNDLTTENEALKIQISNIGDLGAKAEEQRLDACRSEKAVLKRVADIELNVAKYKASLRQLKESVDAQQSLDVEAALDLIRTEMRRDGGEGLKTLQDRAEVIEAANDLLLEAIRENQARFEELKKQPKPPAKKTPTAKAKAPTKPATVPRAVSGRAAVRPGKLGSSLGADGEASYATSQRNRTVLAQTQSKIKPTTKGSLSSQQRSAATAARRGFRVVDSDEEDEYSFDDEDEDHDEDDEDEDAEDYSDDDESSRAHSSPSSIKFLVRKDGTTERPKGTACKTCARAHKRCTCGFNAQDLQASRNRVSRGSQVRKKSRPIQPAKPPAEKAKQQTQPKPRKSGHHFEFDKPIIRSGKGWFEYEETPGESGEEDDEEQEKDNDAERQSLPNKRIRRTEAERLRSMDQSSVIDLTAAAKTRLTRHALMQHSQVEVDTTSRKRAFDQQPVPGQLRAPKRQKIKSESYRPTPDANAGAAEHDAIRSSSLTEWSRRERMSFSTPAESGPFSDDSYPPRREIVQEDGLSAFGSDI